MQLVQTNRRAPALFAATLLIVTSACAINPATGKRQLMLVSEQSEIEIGAQNDRAVVAQMGIYEYPELQQYVDGIGQELAARSERAHLDWTFRVVDDPIVNAFALPGGYIYVTRGILAHLNSEAELASVIGHEIGHVTARHGANQMSKAQLGSAASIGLTVIAPEEMNQFGDIFNQGMGLLFMKFSRDDERQSDDLGLRYMVRANYDPRESPDVYDMLDRVSKAQSGGETVPGWLSTHPIPENRRERMNAAIAELQLDSSGTVTGEKKYLELMDGVVYGPDPREGYFRGSLFIHPDLRFLLDFPDAWDVQNLRQAVVGKSPRGDAMITLTLADAQHTSARQALDGFFGRPSVARVPPKMGQINGLTTAGSGFKGSTEQGTLEGRVGFIEYDGRIYQLIGYSTEQAWESYEGTIRAALASFDQLTDRRALNIQPQRMQIVEPRRTMSLDDFAREYEVTISINQLALINRLELNDTVEAGRKYKVVTGGPQ